MPSSVTSSKSSTSDHTDSSRQHSSSASLVTCLHAARSIATFCHIQK